jgi:hypothetical protein
VLLSFYRDPVVLPLAPALQSGLRYFVEHVFILPFLLALAAWRLRHRGLALALLWVFITLLPTAWLEAYQMHRFFYLPAVGAALLLAQLGSGWWRLTTAPGSALRPLRAAGPVLLAYLLVANVSRITNVCLKDQADSRQARAAFQAIRNAAGQVEPGSLVVIRNLPGSFFVNGMGVLEMVRMGLGDQTAYGVMDQQRMPDAWIRSLNRIPTTYLLDLSHRPLALQRLRGSSPAAQRPGTEASAGT